MKTPKTLTVEKVLKNGTIITRLPDGTECYVVSALEWESLFDEAKSMAYTLGKIDEELTLAAQCEGSHAGGYPSERVLPNLCKIMYASQHYHEQDKYR